MSAATWAEMYCRGIDPGDFGFMYTQRKEIINKLGLVDLVCGTERVEMGSKVVEIDSLPDRFGPAFAFLEVKF